MANDCLAQVQVCALRVGRLGSTGAPSVGASNIYVSDALVTLTVTPEIEEGDEFLQKNGCGSLCVNYKSHDQIKRLGVELTLCTPDPELHEILSGGTRLTNGAAVGWAIEPLSNSTAPNGVSLEFWTRRILDDGSSDSTYPYGWWAMPRVYVKPGAKTFENGAQLSVFSGFATENANWGNGPANDWPVPSIRSIQWIPTASIPTATCGYITSIAS